MQLDLFQHAPRHYHDSIRRLAHLDLEGCRDALGRHRRQSPHGPDPEPVEAAAHWLEARLPEPEEGPGVCAVRVLDLCRALRGAGGDLPGLLRSGTDQVSVLISSLACRGLDAMGGVGATSADPLTSEVPWGVFHLLAGNPFEARSALLEFLPHHGRSAVGWAALGEACDRAGRGDEADRAWREGYGLDHTGGGWAPVAPRIERLQKEFSTDPLFAGPWWAVGAYLEGRLPRYGRTEAAVVSRRWRWFVGHPDQSPPVQFFAGLFLSEQGAGLPVDDLARVRRALRDLHPEAYALHRERLEELGPPEPVARGRDFVA